jgi:tripartite-type tricarboxylate transporter receptor subunit TctC
MLSEGLRDIPAGRRDEIRRAGGSIAMETVARAAPDGYTLLIVSPILTHTPLTRPSLKLDSVRDFTPISIVGTIANLMAVHPSIPVKDVKEFIKVARAQPGKLTYGSSGHGGTFHLITELFSLQAKVRMSHVPYKSVTFAVVDLIRSDVDMVIGTKTSMAQFTGTGKLRIIAVLSKKRLTDLPDVPSIVEQGMPELVVENYYGVVAPGGTPPEIIERLHREIVRIGKLPEFQRALARADIDLVLNTPSELRNSSGTTAPSGRVVRGQAEYRVGGKSSNATCTNVVRDRSSTNCLPRMATCYPTRAEIRMGIFRFLRLPPTRRALRASDARPRRSAAPPRAGATSRP